MASTKLLLTVCIPTMLVLAGAAHAEPGKTTWTGYMYQGPGYHYSVVSEVPQATSLDVGRCADGWCQVTVGDRIGYVLAEIVVTSGSFDKPGPGILAQPAAAVSPLRPPGPCVEANQRGGNGGNAMTRFCAE